MFNNRKKVILLISVLAAAGLACSVPFVSRPVPPPTSPPVTQPAVELPPPPENEDVEIVSPEPYETPTDVADFGGEGIGDPYFPLMGNGGYDVQHYTIDLEIGVPNNFVEGTVTIEALATQDLDAFNLDFVGMDVAQITVNGEDARYTRSDPELTITPATAIAQGDLFTTAVIYSGRPGEKIIAGDALYEQGWINYGVGVIVAGEPYGALNWYPVNGHPLDKATYTLRLTVLESYDVAAVGERVDIIDNGETRTHVFELRQPAASYLVTLGVGEFDEQTDMSSSGVPIRNYFGKGVEQAERDHFKPTGAMIDFFESVFGPYPFDMYGAVVHPVSIGFALETQTLSVFGAGFTWEPVVAHELAHQWFGDSVGLASWQDIWLNEGFASYAQALWIEHIYGQQALEKEIADIYTRTAVSTQPDNIPFPGYIIGDPGPEVLFSRLVYDRGALTLHALRLRIGDEAFFAFIRAYADDFGGGSATTADVIALSEEISGQQLDDLFEAWLYTEALPDIPEMGLTASDYHE